ncbi:Myosin heavy chain [Anaerovibrio sp. JC8]|uniref:DUF3084 domain-containing protein n=1 Tax=Anaerovibrio sp. JC8 TaxID=1240085 RepID=UPI000A0EC27C|nr:DUF3084 domain-containing protein [Anaerovibrio sp. JC8]ORU00933.1 Myosin heavy chain [Anaerovibrio sp. JC8]
MYGLFLIVVLVVVGGAIAFIGDRLGSKVGKKKLTIFGLRPKHTSVLVTILTGISITTMTLAVMTTVSDNVRTALFGMEKLQQTMALTETRLAAASRELENAKAEQSKTEAALATTRDDLNQLMDQRRALEERADELQRGNDMLEAAKAELMAENNNLVAKNHGLADDNAKLVDDNKHLEDRNASLTTGIQIMREGDITFRAGEVLSGGVVKCGRSPEETMNDLRMLTDIARENIARRLGDKATEQEKQIWILETDYQYASRIISESKDDMIVRIVSIGNLVRGEDVRTVLQLYRNKRVFNDGELIATRSIHVDANKDDAVDSEITRFLQEVNGIATQKGVLPDPLSGNVGLIEGEEIYNAINGLKAAHGNATIYAYAKGACEVFGPLRIKLKIIASGVIGAF